VRRKDEILSRRIDEPDVGEPARQARSQTGKLGWLAVDSDNEATTILL